MKVLGIDPGTAACGYAVVDSQGGRLTALDFGWWKTSAREAPATRLKTIHDNVVELIAEHHPDSVSLEESFVGADARIGALRRTGARRAHGRVRLRGARLHRVLAVDA